MTLRGAVWTLWWAFCWLARRVRLGRAVIAALRPGVSRGWPGALLLASGSPLILANADDELFFEIGMTLSIVAEDGSITEAKTDTFDRRKGRREAFADAWMAA